MKRIRTFTLVVAVLVAACGDSSAPTNESVPATTEHMAPVTFRDDVAAENTTSTESVTSTTFPPERLLAWVVEASSTAPDGADSQGSRVSYGAENVQDGLEETAWRTAGNGVGQLLVLDFGRTVYVTDIGMIPGYAKTDPSDDTDRFLQNRRVQTAKYTFGDGSSFTHDLVDQRQLQRLDAEVLTDSVSVEILATTAHGGRDFIAISEIYVFGYELHQEEGSSEDELSYVFPLEPVGTTSYSSGGHSYPAIDIFAPVGTNFVAVTSGVVDELSRIDQWDSAVDDPALRAGLFVSIIGDDGIRYYGSHLLSVADGIEPGDRITPGQLLGSVGQSGNAAGTEAHLHFGISNPTFPGDWETRRGSIDPVLFLDGLGGAL